MRRHTGNGSIPNAPFARMASFFALLTSATQASASLAPSLSKLSVTRTSYYHARHRNHDPSSWNTNQSIFSEINSFSRILYDLRGGDGSSEAGPTAPETYNNNNNYASQPQQQQQQSAPSQMNRVPNFQSTPSGEYLDPNMATNSNDPMYGQRETVEDRIDAWRRQQQQLKQTQSAEEAASPVDDQGRFKLFTHVSRVSVSIFFFILMWRTVHHYELADATFGTRGKGGGGIRAALLRTIVVTPLVVLFLGEMMGAVLGLAGGGAKPPNQSTKKRLKGILNLHKGVELVMIVYNVFRLAIWPSKYTMREVYIGRTISNFFFLMQAQLYTKLSWDDVSMNTVSEGVTESYYDDYYTPEMAGNDPDDFSSWPPATTTATDGDYYNRQDDAPPSQQEQYQQNYSENRSDWS